MEIAEYARVLVRRWRWITAFAVLGLVAGYVYAAVQQPKYTSDAQLFVAVRGDSDTATDLQQGNTFTTQRMTSYTDVASGPLVTRPVIRELGLEESPVQLSQRIEAVSPVDTVLITLTVTDTSPEQAARIANACAEQLGRVIETLEQGSSGRRAASSVKATITRPATVSRQPVSPDVRNLVILGLLAGLGVGVGAAVYREVTDRTLRDREGLEAATGVSVLGIIGVDAAASGRNSAAPDPLHSQDSRAESYRQLRTALTFMNVDRRIKSILVTSAAPAEGKTTTTINLATVLAQTGSRVCVVDADMRRPSLAQVLGLVQDVGISNVLLGTIDVDEAMQGASAEFDVLGVGPLPPNPSELLGTDRMQKLINELESRYDYVLIDTPPVGPVTDAAVLASHVDGVLLVARSGRANRDSVAAAVRTLQAVNGQVVGAVLNMQTSKHSGYSGYSGYSKDFPATETKTGPVQRATGRAKRAVR